MERMNEIVFKRNFRTQIIYLFILLFVTAVGLLMINVKIEDSKAADIILKVIGGFLTLLFGGMSFSMIWNFNKALIVINSRGFIDHGSYNGFIPWSNIESIYKAGSKTKWVNAKQNIGGEIEIKIIDAAKVLNPLSKFKRLIVSTTLSIEKPIIFISLALVKEKTTDVLDIMNKYHSDYQTKNERYGSYQNESDSMRTDKNDIENFDKIIIKRVFLRGIIVLIICLGISCWSLWGMIVAGLEIKRYGIGDELYIKIVTVIAFAFQGLIALFFGSVGIWQIYKFKTKKPILIIDSDGFTDSESNRDFISWSDVEKIDVVTRTTTSRDSDGDSSTRDDTTIHIKLKNKYKFKTKKPILIIDSDGFTDSESNRDFISWSDVEKIDVVTRTTTSRDSDGDSSTRDDPTIDIKLKNKDELILLTLSLAKESPEEVADIMVRYRDEYIKENSIKKTIPNGE